jgi:hypothetical protein
VNLAIFRLLMSKQAHRKLFEAAMLGALVCANLPEINRWKLLGISGHLPMG